MTAPIVVVDLTDSNPNVYWELGVRQSFKHGTITIAEKGTELPFDLGVKGTLFYYPEDYIKMSEFRDELTTLINRNSMENGSNTPDFLLAEYLTGCLEIFDTVVTKRDKHFEFEHPLMNLTKLESK